MTAGRIAVGSVLVAIGLVFALDATGIVDAGAIVSRWWPLSLVLLGSAQMALERRASFATTVLVTIGLFALAGTTGALQGRLWSLAWPAAMILVGAWLAFGRRQPAIVRSVHATRLAVLTSTGLQVRTKGFRSADLTAVLGAVRCDLTKADLDPGGGRVSATAILGSVVVIVPEGWKVRVRGLPVFGGWDDTTSRVVAPGAPELEVRAVVVLGGVEARHPRRW
jgi:predicted membrane protein